MRAIIKDFELSIKNWYRNKAAVFWTVAFPVLLILIFGAIFSGGEQKILLGIQDLDNSFASKAFIENISKIEIVDVKIIKADEDIKEFVKEHGAALQIPKGFQDALINKEEINLTLYLDPSKETTNSAVRTFVANVLNELNIRLNNGRNYIRCKEESVVSKEYEYIDFFIPGVIGMTIMTSAIYGSVEINLKYRKRGILKKLLTTPLKRSYWIFAKMLYFLFLAFLSTFIIVGVGKLVFDAKITLNLFSLLTIISASFAFTGIGMLIARFVNEEESADSAASAIIFPMMFLAGTFFPLEMMPSYLQIFAKILPLYYVNEGLRNAMIFRDFHKSLLNLAIISIFAIIVFIMGTIITKWEED